MGISDNLTYLLRNLYSSREAIVQTGYGIANSSKLGKECVKAIYCHLACLT